MYWGEDWPSRASVPRFRLTLVTPPVLSPITVQDAKEQLHITHDDWDGQIVNWIAAATRKVEQDTELALLSQTWDLALTSFPDPLAVMSFPIRPVQSVPATQYVKYYDAAGVLQTMPDTDYVFDASGLTLGLALNASWPSDLWTARPVVVRFVAGYVSADLVPEDLKQAIRFLVGHYSENRQATQVDRQQLIDMGYDDHIRPYVRHLAA